MSQGGSIEFLVEPKPDSLTNWGGFHCPSGTFFLITAHIQAQLVYFCLEN